MAFITIVSEWLNDLGTPVLSQSKSELIQFNYTIVLSNLQVILWEIHKKFPLYKCVTKIKYSSYDQFK